LKKYNIGRECGRIRIRKGRWLLPLEAITQKNFKPKQPNKIIKVSECPRCKDTITLNIITNSFPVISGI